MTEASALAHARMLLDIGRAADALSAARSYLATNPDDPEALSLAAGAHLMLNSTDAAVESSRRAVVVAPDQPMVWQVHAAALSAAGDHDRAVAAAGNALRLNPDSAQSNIQVAIVDLAAGRVTASTRSAAATAVRLEPDNPSAHAISAEVAHALKQRPETQASYRDALRLDPLNTNLRNNILATGPKINAGQAAAGYIDILATDPRYPLALHNLKSSIHRAALMLHRILWFGWAIANLSFLPSISGGFFHDPVYGPAVRWALVAYASIALITYLARTRKYAGSRFRKMIKSAQQFGGALRGWGIAIGAAYAFLVTAAFVPVPYFRMAYIACFAALLTGMLFSRRLKRDSDANLASIPGARRVS